MESPANLRFSKPTFNIHFNLHQKSPQNLSFPLLFRVQEKSTPVRFPAIRASSSSSSPSPKPSLLKTTCISLTVAAALFSASSYFIFRRPSPMIVLETKLETETQQSNNLEALLSLTKIKFELGKQEQAIQVLNRMIEIEPNEPKWPAMKARILSHNSQTDLAIEAFEEILKKDPTRIDAYHYLVMEYQNSKPKLTELEKRINEALRRCKKKEKKKICNFRMLIAQIRVIEGNFVEAIQICEEVVKDDPEDFMVYMFQGTVYTLMKKEDEAMKQFEEGTRLIPKDHPYVADEMNIDEWRVILDYDSTYCYLITFAKLAMGTFFDKKFG